MKSSVFMARRTEKDILFLSKVDQNSYCLYSFFSPSIYRTSFVSRMINY